MKDTIKSPSIDTGIDITKMHGHMDIYLTDVKTGKVEEVHEDNMMTNALQAYFRNCGFLNYPNVNQNSLVPELLGGVMGFSEEIDEDASIVHVPAGNKMIFNGSIGTLNNSAPTELGSYSADESGWQQDGSYVQTYDYSTSQANGTISCVCLTGKNYGYAGEGNSTSLVSKSQRISIKNLNGTVTNYTIPSSDKIVFPFNFNLSDSTCYAFEVEGAMDVHRNVEEQDVHCYLRKYRLPISKINIKGTQTSPILISEQEVVMDSDFLTNFNIIKELSFYTIKMIPFNGNLMMYNMTTERTSVWGEGFTQRLWTLTPNGSVSKTSIVNTSGDTLPGMRVCIFDGNYIFFATSTWDEDRAKFITGIDTTKIYVLNRTTGVIDAITNPYGTVRTDPSAWDNATWDFNKLSGSGDGRIVTDGGYIVDALNGETYPTNADVNYNRFNDVFLVNGLIMHRQTALYRDQTYIASINNLDNPVVKTSEKTMKVIYRITFDEQ